MTKYYMGVARRAAGFLLAAQILTLSSAGLANREEDDDGDADSRHILAIQHAVPHTSGVPANLGERVELFAWERVSASSAKKFSKKPPTGKVVLFIHGGSIPSVPAFDVDY
jgi:hypothetical protein